MVTSKQTDRMQGRHVRPEASPYEGRSSSLKFDASMSGMKGTEVGISLIFVLFQHKLTSCSDSLDHLFHISSTGLWSGRLNTWICMFTSSRYWELCVWYAQLWANPLTRLTPGICFPSDPLAQLQPEHQGYNMYNCPEASQQCCCALSPWHQWLLIIGLPLSLCISLMERVGERVGDFLCQWCLWIGLKNLASAQTHTSFSPPCHSCLMEYTHWSHQCVLCFYVFVMGIDAIFPWTGYVTVGDLPHKTSRLFVFYLCINSSALYCGSNDEPSKILSCSRSCSNFLF